MFMTSQLAEYIAYNVSIWVYMAVIASVHSTPEK